MDHLIRPCIPVWAPGNDYRSTTSEHFDSYAELDQRPFFGCKLSVVCCVDVFTIAGHAESSSFSCIIHDWLTFYTSPPPKKRLVFSRVLSDQHIHLKRHNQAEIIKKSVFLFLIRRNSRFFISDMQVQNKKYGNFVFISRWTGKCATQKI